MALTGIGMMTPVGYDFAASCAAIRARILRPRPVPYWKTLDPEAMASVPIVGCSIRGVTEGFNIIGLWVRVGTACLRELFARAGIPTRPQPRFLARTGLIAVPPPLEGARFGTEGRVDPGAVRSWYLSRLLEVNDLPIPEANHRIVALGHAGVIAALVEARTMLADSSIERVLIMAVDSYLDPLTLQWLSAGNRLKTPEQPTGLVPGEAGVCLMVETPDACAARGGQPLARIHTPCLDQEAQNLAAGETSQGTALARVAAAAIDAAGPGSHPDSIVTDQNGEHWRAHEWGFARVRLGDRMAPDTDVHFPSQSTGETGAASGGVGIGLAVHAMQRCADAPRMVLVTSTSEHGPVAAVCVSARQP